MYFRDGEADVAAQPSLQSMLAVCLAAIFVIQLGVYPSMIVDLAQRFQ
jgi:NADH:ubiquinone oxidoreductase subunit 2 (subunit N)